MRTKLALMIGITGLAVAGWSAASWAHHGFAAELDADKPWSAIVLREQRLSPRDPRYGLTMLLAPDSAIELRS